MSIAFIVSSSRILRNTYEQSLTSVVLRKLLQKGHYAKRFFFQALQFELVDTVNKPCLKRVLEVCFVSFGFSYLIQARPSPPELMSQASVGNALNSANILCPFV